MKLDKLLLNPKLPPGARDGLEGVSREEAVRQLRDLRVAFANAGKRIGELQKLPVIATCGACPVFEGPYDFTFYSATRAASLVDVPAKCAHPANLEDGLVVAAETAPPERCPLRRP